MNNTVKITKRKSAMAAAGKYDYMKLTHGREGFLPCTLTETKEEVELLYEITDMVLLPEIKKEKRAERLLTLMDIAKFEELSGHHHFSLAPENLYMDLHRNVYVMYRDVYAKGETADPEEFLMGYKALIGSVLQKKYTYQDYFDGGLELLKKDKFLNAVYQCETPDAIYHALGEEYEKVIAENKRNKVEVSRKKSRFSNITMVLGMIVLIAAAGFGSWFAFWIMPYNQAVNTAQNAWLESDYIGVMNALKPVSTTRMDVHQKYILTAATVRCESLTQEQKDNILSPLTLTSDEKIFDYWIYIGRLEAENAVDTALQLSDDQMLLYAYMKEKYLIEIDTALQGEEKSAALKDVEGNIAELAKIYETEESE